MWVKMVGSIMDAAIERKIKSHNWTIRLQFGIGSLAALGLSLLFEYLLFFPNRIWANRTNPSIVSFLSQWGCMFFGFELILGLFAGYDMLRFQRMSSEDKRKYFSKRLGSVSGKICVNCDGIFSDALTKCPNYDTRLEKAAEYEWVE